MKSKLVNYGRQRIIKALEQDVTSAKSQKQNSIFLNKNLHCNIKPISIPCNVKIHKKLFK